MTAKYFTLLTNVGAAKLANAAALGEKLEITAMAVGDANGTDPTPDPAQTKLVHERRRALLNSLRVDPDNASQVIAEQVLAETVGGWWIREMGLYDASGDLIAIGNCPPSYKPLMAEGSGREQIIRMILIVSSSDAVELKIDPAVVLATREYVDDAIEAHAKSRNHPDATTSAKGLVQLSSATNSTSETLAATPKAVKAAYDLANGKLSSVPDATTAAKGVVQLSSATNSASESLAATPKAVKAAYDLATKALPVHTDPLTVDLNTLGAATQAGVYCQTKNAGATDELHYPIKLAGSLLLTPSAYGCQQEYTEFTTGRKFQRSLTATWNGKDGPWGDWREYYSENHLPPSYGWGMGPQHRDDAYNNTAMIYRVNGTSANTPGPNVYCVISGPCDGGPSTAYLALQNSGRAFFGYSNLPENGVIWTEAYTVKNPPPLPTAEEINALPLSGGTMTDEIKSTSGNILRGIQGGYGAILRMDANGLYFLQTNKDDPNGNYNDKRSLTISNDTGAVGIGTQLTVTNADFINKVGYTTYTGGDGHNHAQVGGLRLEVDGSQLAELYYNVDTTSQSAEVSLHNKYGTTDSYLSLRNDGQLAIVGSWPAITMSTGTTWHPDGNIQGSCWEGDYLSNWLLTKVMPVGAALPWPQETPPPGWLLCNGSGFDRNACPRLAGVFPNGILPDYRGVFLRGKDNARGIDPNRALGDFQASQAPASSAAGMGWHDYAGRDTGHISQMGSDNTYNYTVKQETEQQRETRPANVSVNYIVRAA
ncbi:phage tail protein [Serratia ureilytica]|uniref:Phage tail protein n=1 Tax=Serratia ureilytica TaxID=300181 RepID=A0A9X9BZL6_9GAMM|nr:phage tail protein [Serratia ureilytica]TXE26934.1 hypothetical protein FOT63_18545 [Serratia ureilytica]